MVIEKDKNSFEQSFMDSVTQSGDIIIPKEKSSKPKGKLILIIILVLVAIGAVAALVIVAMTKNNSGVSGNVADTRLAFNKYLNYLVSGEESDKPIEFKSFLSKNYSPTIPKNLYAEKVIDGSIENDGYIDKLNQYYNDFIARYYQLYPSDSDNTRVISDYYYSMGKLQEMLYPEVAQFYLENGHSATKDHIYNLTTLSSPDSANVEKYYTNRRDKMMEFLTIADEADSAGCIKDSYDYVCAEKFYDAKKDKITEYNNEALSLKIDMRRTSMNLLLEFYEKLNPDAADLKAAEPEEGSGADS